MSDRPAPLIPPHIGWPLMVILLLLMSVVAGVGTAVMANMDGGARPIETVNTP